MKFSVFTAERKNLCKLHRQVFIMYAFLHTTLYADFCFVLKLSKNIKFLFLVENVYSIESFHEEIQVYLYKSEKFI